MQRLEADKADRAASAAKPPEHSEIVWRRDEEAMAQLAADISAKKAAIPHPHSASSALRSGDLRCPAIAYEAYSLGQRA
jgi:hypothetical protein